MFSSFLLLLSTFVLVVTGLDLKDQPLLVQTQSGLVQGHLEPGGARLWAGIPYAAPPVGDLRFEYPVQPAKFSGTYEANFVAPGCPQDCVLPPGNCPLTKSEDCLYLSVFSPNSPPPSDSHSWPTLVWFHGGAYEQGLGNCALYNGTTFAQQGVVTVVLNYRLGALGFMASSSMKGNYGMMDQRLALQWVQDNIKAFGGDPERVTIAGQSAGAMSVGTHLVSAGSKGLFSAAIMESNPLGLPYHTRGSAAKNADAVFKYLGCATDDVACMRTKTADEIVKAQKDAIKMDRNTLFINFLGFSPLVEKGGELPDQPFNMLARGEMHTVPTLSGSLYDEGQLFVYELFTKEMSSLSYKSTVDLVFGKKAGKQVLDKYPMQCSTCPPDNEDGRAPFNELATDLLFYCPLRNSTRGSQAALGAQAPPTYLYRFKHILSFDCWGPDYAFCKGICCHGSELPFVFNVFSDGNIEYAPTTDEKKLAQDVGGAWTNFITKHVPSSPSVPQTYVTYSAAADELVVLDEPLYPAPGSDASAVRTEWCNMWDQLGYLNW